MELLNFTNSKISNGRRITKQTHRTQKDKKESRSISVNLRITLGLILFKAIIKKTNVAVKSRIKAITYQHEKKLNNLRKLQQNYVNTKTKQHPVKQIIHDFSLSFFIFHVMKK